ncbi:aminotransferase class I/II-fold pyridoxal phosphate-dependent enzyme [Desmospora profundinema]|uniref:Arginine/lysine/ornithine decarboxylase n=1 Tax=Desmospora profundinema TaxID=1571184 RepID=A0ABU1IQZ0_9BACL|nr:aminotransferase class I/II-fold pyridoxal phosphate-dependent enzyme [Desmospora profundinema]MDR6227138.1 arginine/lysine/ornithine decarboxylase [Desmospora profundinema]
MKKNGDQHRAPLWEALVQHAREGVGNYHVPGHKSGRFFDREGWSVFSSLLTIDLTEVGQLDDLHQAEGAIADAQKLAAACFGADRTFFLVGGSTAGNLALVLSTCSPGDRLIVQREAHQSVWNGCVLAGVRPVYISGGVDHEGFPRPLDPEWLREAFRRYPNAKAALITSPDYDGHVQPIQALAQVCHEWNRPLLVDEAHGAHFGIHPHLPPSALSQGADASVQSTHKLLSAMTQASMLHLKGSRVNSDKVASWLRILQSSSPSYPLMASLDLARRLMAMEGEQELGQLLERLKGLRLAIQDLDHILEMPASMKRDPLKMPLNARVKGEAVSGIRLARFLEKQHLWMELSDHRRVLAVFTPGNREKELSCLRDALQKLDRLIPSFPREPLWCFPETPQLVESKQSLDELFRRPAVSLPLVEAVGRVAKEAIVPYPPGIPVVLPGEIYTEQHLFLIQDLSRNGAKIRGLAARSPLSVFVLQ